MADPLWASTDHRLYVPTESFEAALSALEIGLRAGCSPLLLSGPHGIGKSLLLRVLAERQSLSFQRTWLLTLSGEPEDLPGVLLRVLFDVVPPRRSRAAQAALIRALHADCAPRTLVLVDDAHEQSGAALCKLAEIAGAAKRTLALVLAGTGCEDRHDLADALGAGLSVLLPESLPDAEILTIYDAIVAHPGLSPRLRARLGEGDRAEIVGLAHGVPQQLKRELARRRPRREPIPPSPPPPDPEPTWDELDKELPELTLDWSELLIEEPKPPVAVTRAEVSLPGEPELGLPLEREPVPTPALRPATKLRPESRVLELARFGFVFSLASWELALGAFAQVPERLAGGARAPTRAFAALGARCRAAWTASREWTVRHSAELAAGSHAALSRVSASSRRAQALSSHGLEWMVLRSRAVATAAGARRARIQAQSHAALERMSASSRRVQAFSSHGLEWTALRSREIATAAGARRARIQTQSQAALERVSASSRRVQAFSSHGLEWTARRSRELAGVSGGRLRRVTRGLDRVAQSALAGVSSLSRRAVQANAIPIALVLIAAVFALPAHAPKEPARPARAVHGTPLPKVERANARAVPQAPPAPPIEVHVNARPWAHVWINGKDVGATPLRRPLAPGSHRIEARFPDGRRVARVVQVDPAHRFIALR